MIRDPSDGSVRQIVDNNHGAKSSVMTGDQKPSLQHESGLPLESQKADRQACLEKSRAWLKQYFKRNPEQGT